jgi:excisionase family DNA binding protein
LDRTTYHSTTSPLALRTIDAGAPGGVPPLALGIMDAARAAGVGRSTIYENINSGALKARKAGRRTLIHREDLQAWLASFPAKAAA